MYSDWELEGIAGTSGAWNQKYKEQWLLNYLFGIAAKKASNVFEVELRDVLESPEQMEDPIRGSPEILLYKHEQREILDRLVFRNILKIESEGAQSVLSIRLLEKTRPELSMYVRDGYKTLRDVLLDGDLRNSLFEIILRAYGVLDARQIGRTQSIKTDVNESWNGIYQDEKLLLLEAIGIARVDWEGLKSQTHRTYGNRLISVYFDGDKVNEFINSILGNRAIIDKRVLKEVAEVLVNFKSSMTVDNWADFFLEHGVPLSLFSTNAHNDSPSDFIYKTILILSSTSDETDRWLLEKVLSEAAHPLFYKGDESTASKCEQELNKLLKYSGLMLRGGRLLTLEKVQLNQIPNRAPVIKPQALERVSFIIKDLKTANGIRSLFTQIGVPESALPPEASSKQQLVHGVLAALSDSGREEDKALLFRIFEEMCHPLNFGGDSKKAKEIAIKITILIRYDGLSLIGGSVHSFSQKDEEIVTAYEEGPGSLDNTNIENFNEPNGNTSSLRSGPKPNAQQSTLEDLGGLRIYVHNVNQIAQSAQPSNVAADPKKGSSIAKKTLKDAEVLFDDDTATIRINDTDCKLPPISNQHLFCRAIFQYRKGEAVDWSTISEVMTGKKWIESTSAAAKAEKQAVRDAMYAVNKRVAEVYGTEDKLFCMSKKSVSRMH